MKTVMLLINGFGIETKESYSIYDANLMPNFDLLTKKYMFQSLNSNVDSIYEGYRNMSLEINELYNYHIYERELLSGNIFKNNTYTVINSELQNRKSKLHIFVLVDTSLKIVDNIKSFIKQINKDHDKKIFLHIVLTSTNYEDYPQIINVLSKINVDLSDYATIGMIMGLENLLNSNPITELNFFLKILISEVGEKWQSFKQKLDVSYGTKTSPTAIKPFVVNSGFGIEANDLFVIWNYDNIDITNFIDGIKRINYGEISNNVAFYSLFPITYHAEINYFFNYETSPKSLATNMKGLDFKSLILTNKEQVSIINYYLNGLNNVNNPDISYLAMDNIMYDVNSIVNIINTNSQELIIINYDITSVLTVEELQNTLNKIDKVIEGIYKNTEKNSYNIIISSLFGMNKTIPNQKGEICHIDYNKVPIVYINNFITRKNYLINEGSINELLKICYYSISKKYMGTSLIVKKNWLYRLIFK